MVKYLWINLLSVIGFKMIQVLGVVGEVKIR